MGAVSIFLLTTHGFGYGLDIQSGEGIAAPPSWSPAKPLP